MKRKIFAALLMAGALAVVPCGNLFSMVATASTNNTVSAGSSSVTASANNTVSANYEAKFEKEIALAKEGGTVTITRDQGINTLSNDLMKTLLERGDVTLVLECSYAGVDYTIVIPAGKAVDNDIPWYGPLYLLSIYGDSTSSDTNTAGGSNYIVQANDTMSKIARKYGMTLTELVKMNPQIKNINRIRVGQIIKVK